MNNDLVVELYALTKQFIENIRNIALSTQHEEQNQLLEFVATCDEYMKRNPVHH